MQATADQERSRVVDDTERRRSVRVDEIRTRETAEAARMRELAAEDQAGIDAWAETEVARIQAEQQRRTEALEADLETSLGKHRELIAQEIERVESAIATYRTDVDAFFDTLEHETDPVAIAQIATRRPVFPSLDTVPLTADEPAEPAAVEALAPEEPALAAASGIDAEPTIEPDSFAYSTELEEPAETPTDTATTPSEPALVGVMDYAPDPFGDPWRDLPETVAYEPVQAAEVESSASGDSDDTAEESTADVEAPADAVGSAPRGRSVLQAVPALRPMGSWLGRHANSDRPDIHS
jgi:hypothetical protein